MSVGLGGVPGAWAGWELAASSSSGSSLQIQQILTQGTTESRVLENSRSDSINSPCWAILWMELKVERQPKYKVKETETKVAAEWGCGGGEPAITPESSGDICMVFSYLLFTAAMRAPGALKVIARGKPFVMAFLTIWQYTQPNLHIFPMITNLILPLIQSWGK